MVQHPFVNRLGILLSLTVILLMVACRGEDGESVRETPARIWEPYNDSAEVAGNAEHPNPRMRYKLIQSRVWDKNDTFRELFGEAMQLKPERYEELRPMILGSDIPALQRLVREEALTYEELARFYLYRIYRYELDSTTTLHTVLALNPELIREARARDYVRRTLPDEPRHPIFGIPILLKDNIGMEGMPTTAGAIALKDNRTGDAYIVKRLRQNGALLMGKVNLSEWAYYFCDGCPVGYSAMGGQTLNPYGRRVYETGGSSSGSGTAVAAGYAVAAVGTETSGSILSPSGQNSVTGLKPTVGLLGRSGIVPISGTLDTPGPMARNVTDAGILLAAMTGFDPDDVKSTRFEFPTAAFIPSDSALSNKRLGVLKPLLESDSLYRQAVAHLKAAGAEIVSLEPEEVRLEGFLQLLNADMRLDLPAYLSQWSGDSVLVKDVADVVAYNLQDSLLRAPYGQARLEGILSDTTAAVSVEEIKAKLKATGRRFFDGPWQAHKLDAVLSVNNYHAGHAAVAEYPAVSVPMGYRADGEPANLTWIAKPWQERQLLNMAWAFERLGPWRKMPEAYKE